VVGVVPDPFDGRALEPERLVHRRVELGLSPVRIGLLLSLTLAGDALVSLWLSTVADRFGRRRVLVIGALLVAPSVLGAISFGANLLAGVSALAAAPLARKIGLIETMVVTHIPSNVLLMAVPLMPTAPSAIVVLLLRFSISQMDVPTLLLAVPALMSLPFLLSGSIKIVYDVLVWRGFRAVRPAE